MFVNHSLKQVTAKIVYYGPGLSGKTTNLQYIFSVTNPKTRGELVSIETEIERTLFFDLLPLNVGIVKDYQTKFQLYTVPGQIFYDSTRKLVLKGADGIVFVVDSQSLREQAGLESFENLKGNLATYNIDIKELPLVYQFNKRDLDSISSVERLKKVFHIVDDPYFEAVATDGVGVIETLKEISSLTLKKVIKLIDKISKEEINNGPVNFDTNQNQEIKKLEDLPVRKIPMEDIESFSEKMNEGQEEINAYGRKAAKKEDIFNPDTGKEYDTILADEAVINLPDEEEEVFTLDEDVMVDEEEEHGTRIFSRNEFDTAIELEEKNKEADDKELPFANLPEDEIEDDNILNLGDENIAPFENKAMPNISPPKQNEYATIVKAPDEEFPFEDLPEQDLDDLSKIDEPEDEEDIQLQEPDFGNFGKVEEPVKPFRAGEQDLEFDLDHTRVQDVLKKFEDQTRIAIIRKVSLKDPQLFIDVKDKNGNVLEKVELYVNPDIKKVTVILDVKN